MTFKVGDKVRYTEAKCYPDYPEMQGWEAEVVQLNGTLTKVRTTKNPGGHDRGVAQTGQYMTANLELIEQPFTFADIQVGDRIRRTLTRDTGTTEVREGVVVEKSDLYATDYTSRGRLGTNYILAYSSDGHPDKPTVKLELLERPEPPHWAESKPVGSVGVILDGVFTKALRKTSEHSWNVHYLEDEHAYRASNDEIKARTAQWASESKLTWIK